MEAGLLLQKNTCTIEEYFEEVLPSMDQSYWFLSSGTLEAIYSTVLCRKELIVEARKHLLRAQVQIPDNPLSNPLLFVIVAEAELAIAEGRWEDAISKSNSLLEWYTRAGMRWDQAHTLLDLGEIHRMRGGRGDREQAVDLYNQAREIFAEIGAVGYVDIVNTQIQDLTGGGDDWRE